MSLNFIKSFFFHPSTIEKQTLNKVYVKIVFYPKKIDSY